MRDLDYQTYLFRMVKTVAAETCICDKLCEALNNESCADVTKKS